MPEFNQPKPSRFEQFGLYYLNIFRRYSMGQSAFQVPDALLTKRVKTISLVGIAWSSVVGIICVFPMIWVDLYYANAPFFVHYGWVAGVTILATAIEFYCLFYISLKAVHKVSELINMQDNQHQSLDGIFGVKNILARTALEIDDPELKILGIDPFKQISKKNLFVLGLLYKGKIIVTNFILKYSLRFTAGNELLGIPILYAAIPVEVFWNSMVIKKVIYEARLRLFGYALANKIADTMQSEGYLGLLSPMAKKGCLRAIGNAVVMTRNYHPNMVILLLRFRDLLQIDEEDRYDDWELFLHSLNSVSDKERNFLLDLFTVAAAFDGKLSVLEKDHLKAAYQQDFDLYYGRLEKLTGHLKDGRLNAALSLCRLDFIKG
ncbi:LBF_2804 family protein [Flavihumibacter fluvii]|uniref:LBF_2804 family protein n=1 Tax=Flavihumibacter fluvii TaxID=2838157 RepID=UPI001BDE7AE4|nr:hypothetical protein [Flavihumibacter fluvii]ULQ51032.1 hypothetical protein KJS93_13155 [Flavihumibacter fluvii]